MRASPEKYKSHNKEAENRSPPKDLEEIMESLLTSHLDSKFEDGDDEHEDSTTALSAHTDYPSKRKRDEEDGAKQDPRPRLQATQLRKLQQGRSRLVHVYSERRCA